jgi:hypothetical protein
VRSRSPEELSPYEAVLRSFSYPQRPSPEELVPARAGLEVASRYRDVGRVKFQDAHRYRRERNILSERSDDVR